MGLARRRGRPTIITAAGLALDRPTAAAAPREGIALSLFGVSPFMRSLMSVLLASAALAIVPSCTPKTSSDGTASAPANADTAPPVTADNDAEGKDPERSDVTVDPRITAMCGIDEPNFAFNSSALSSQAKRVLNAIAACFKDGPAAGHSMRLVGHADPRGDEEYNFGLGQQRADNVGRYLAKRGVGNDRLETSSRGELDAVGTDEAGWKRDRKVEILLAD